MKAMRPPGCNGGVGHSNFFHYVFLSKLLFFAMFPFCFLPINLWTKVWCSVTIVLDHYYGITMIESSVTEFLKPDLIVWTNNFGAFFVGSVYPDLLYIDVSIVLAPSILTYMAKTFKISTITINLQTGVLLQPFPLLQWPAQGIYYKIIFVTLFC